MNWIQRKVYLYNVTFGLYMLDFWERALFNTLIVVLMWFIFHNGSRYVTESCESSLGYGRSLPSIEGYAFAVALMCICGAVLWEEGLNHSGDDLILTFALFICGEFWCKDCIGPQDVMKEFEKICRNFDGLPPQTLCKAYLGMACKKDDLVGKWVNKKSP